MKWGIMWNFFDFRGIVIYKWISYELLVIFLVGLVNVEGFVGIKLFFFVVLIMDGWVIWYVLCLMLKE